MCCDPSDYVGGQYVTYHKLTGVDDSLSSVLADYFKKPNVIGLIIINTTGSPFLSNEFSSKEGGLPQSSPPVYVISSADGEQLTNFIAHNKQETVEVKVSVESAVDYTKQLLSGLCVMWFKLCVVLT